MINDGEEREDLTVYELDPIDQVMHHLDMAIQAMKLVKGDQRNEFARKCQILITDAEKVAGLWDSWISRYVDE